MCTGQLNIYDNCLIDIAETEAIQENLCTEQSVTF